jgi:hypothetical protein
VTEAEAVGLIRWFFITVSVVGGGVLMSMALDAVRDWRKARKG